MAGKFDACPYPAGRLCEGKINGDAVNRKECHYGGYHFCDRGKPEVFAAGANARKFTGEPLVFFRPLWRNATGIFLRTGLAVFLRYARTT
jgi:hypothetical protein